MSFAEERARVEAKHGDPSRPGYTLLHPRRRDGTRRDPTWHFDVDFASDKDELMAGRVVAGTSRVVVESPDPVQARLIAEQMVAARGKEPTGARLVSTTARRVATDQGTPAVAIQPPLKARVGRSQPVRARVSEPEKLTRSYNPDLSGIPRGMEQRLGRCYELAGRFTTNNVGTLVHGSIQGYDNPRIGHAWVELPDGNIWEPASAQIWPAAIFAALFNPEVEWRYDEDKMYAEMARSKHWGPWEEPLHPLTNPWIAEFQEKHGDPSRPGYYRYHSPKKNRSFFDLFNLNDGVGGFEKQLRIIANALGVDPYDVDIKKLKGHADLHERDARSRFPTKSPCYFYKMIDFTIHRWLPGILAEEYPELAQALLDTSPRWGRLARPEGTLDLPAMKALFEQFKHGDPSRLGYRALHPNSREHLGEALPHETHASRWARWDARVVRDLAKAPSFIDPYTRRFDPDAASAWRKQLTDSYDRDLTERLRQLREAVDVFQTKTSADYRADMEYVLGGGETDPDDDGYMHAETLIQAIHHAPPIAPEVYRGTSRDATPEEIMDKYPPGRSFQMSPASFSTDKWIAENFAGAQRETPGLGTGVIFRLHKGGQAFPVQPLTTEGSFYDEAEWITGGQFHVTGTRVVEIRNGHRVVIVDIEQEGTFGLSEEQKSLINEATAPFVEHEHGVTDEVRLVHQAEWFVKHGRKGEPDYYLLHPKQLELRFPSGRSRGRSAAAVEWAKELHKGQTRKGSNKPYVSHVLQVGQLVKDDGGNEAEYIAAVLHDAVEDTPATLDQVRARFGNSVAKMVETVSELERPEPAWKQRKITYIAQLSDPKATLGALRVSAADKLANATDTLNEVREVGPSAWDKFESSPEEQLWFYRSVSDTISDRMDTPLAAKLRQVVTELEVLSFDPKERWHRTPAGRNYRALHVGKNGTLYYLTNEDGSYDAFTERYLPRYGWSKNLVGRMTTWSKGEGEDKHREIFKIAVDDPHRRQGIASALLALARQDEPDLQHSPPMALTEDGKAWAAAVKTLDPDEQKLASQAEWFEKHGDKGEPGYELLHPGKARAVLAELVKRFGREVELAAERHGPPWSTAHTAKIGERSSIFVDFDRLGQIRDGLPDTRMKTPKDVIIHEYGHALAHGVRGNDWQRLHEPVLMDWLHRDTVTGEPTNPEAAGAIAKEISPYATHGDNEFIAETFLAWNQGVRNRWTDHVMSILAPQLEEKHGDPSRPNYRLLHPNSVTPAGLAKRTLRRGRYGGGFTFNVHTKLSPRKGYAVSPYPQWERKWTQEEFAEQGEDLIAQYIKDHMDELSEPGRYLGGWWDAPTDEYEGSDNVYLDVVEVLSDEQDAFDLAHEAGQDGIMNLTTRKYIEVGARASRKDTSEQKDAHDHRPQGSDSWRDLGDHGGYLGDSGDPRAEGQEHNDQAQEGLEARLGAQGEWFEKHGTPGDPGYQLLHPNSKIPDRPGVPKKRVAKLIAEAAEPEEPHETTRREGMRFASDEDRKRMVERSVVIPPAWTYVQIAESATDKLQAVGYDEAAREQRLYSTKYMAQQAAIKWDRVKKLSKHLGDLDKALQRDYRDPAAGIVVMIRRMGLRPGSEDDTRGAVQAYGASTLKAGDVTLRTGGKGPEDDVAELHFVGKHGVDIVLSTSDPLVIRTLRSHKRGKKPDEPLFAASDAAAARYFKKQVGDEFKIKDLRTHFASAFALAMVKKMAVPKTKKEFKDARRAVAKATSALLGNTPKVALDRYISPTTFGKWERALRKLEKASG